MADHQNAKQKRNRTTNAQKEFLIDYMNTHPEFAAGRYCGQMVQKNSERQWERLTHSLNGLGNVKSVGQWQKVWADLKCRARNKTKDAAKNLRQTGNPSMDSSLILTPHDTKILSTIGAQSCLGHQSIPYSMESPQVVFEGGRLVVLEAEHDEDEALNGPLEEAFDTEVLEFKMDAPISAAPQETVMDAPILAAPQESQSPSPPTATGAGQSMASAAGPSTASTGPSTSTTAAKESFPKPISSVRQHFSRTRDHRERRVGLAAEMKEQFAQIQESQAKSQEMMAKALLKLAETDAARLQLDAARLEQYRVTSTVIFAMAEAIRGWTRAMECRRSHDEDMG